MSLLSWLRKSNSTRPTKSRSRRLSVEALEDRMVLSTFYAATASDLIADIKAANLQGGANTIVLTAPPTSSRFAYQLTATNNTTDGANVLPVIAPGDSLTIQSQNGSLDTIDAWPTSNVRGQIIGNFRGPGRLFDVAQGASLTLENMQVENGTELLSGKGGAILNQGTLVLSNVLVSGNTVAPTSGDDAAGGGIWSNGSLTVENSTFQSNVAYGQPMGSGNAFGGAICIEGGTANITGSTFGSMAYPNSAEAYCYGGAYAYGGAVYVGGGTVTMSGDTVGSSSFSSSYPSNGAATKLGGGLAGYGGGLCVAGGTVTLRNDKISGNMAGHGDLPNATFTPNANIGYGGGIFIASGAKVYLDSFTQANTSNNWAPNFDGWLYHDDINGNGGWYFLLPQIGSFTASPNPVPAGTSLALTASNISDGNPGATITQVSFYYFDSTGAKHVLGNGTQSSTGVWTLTVKANLAPGTYTLYAQALDSSGLFSDRLALTLTVQ
jgi:hypothetical protein